MKTEPYIPTTIYLTKDQLMKIQHKAIDIDSNMSAIIRELIDGYFEGEENNEK